MFKLLDAKNVLEHLVELLFAQNQLGGCTGGHPGLLLPGVLFPAVDGVKLGHPGAQHGLLAEAVDLGQAAHPLLNVLLEDLPRVVGGAAPTLHHAGHAVTLQEHLSKTRQGKTWGSGPWKYQFLGIAGGPNVVTSCPCLLAVQTQGSHTHFLLLCPNLENENNNSTDQVVARIKRVIS